MCVCVCPKIKGSVPKFLSQSREGSQEKAHNAQDREAGSPSYVCLPASLILLCREREGRLGRRSFLSGGRGGMPVFHIGVGSPLEHEGFMLGRARIVSACGTFP